MKCYDVAVIGGGAAGTMAAIRASQLKKSVLLVERNDAIGRKILLTGKGRCNVTNAAPIDTFIEKFGRHGRFLRTAFTAFSNDDLIDLFRSTGLEMKIERQGRVFPVTDRSRSVIEALKKRLEENGVEVLCNARAGNISAGDGLFRIDLGEAGKATAKKVILATGGASYKETGSTGDGFSIAGRFGHRIEPLKPALVPLVTKERWVKELQGLSLENIRLTFRFGNNKIVSDIGEFIFTHFGVSGPLVLDLSGDIVTVLDGHKEIMLFIDLKPGLTAEQLEKRLLNEFKAGGSARLKSIMKGLMPQRLITVFLDLSGADPDRKGSRVTQDERRAMIRTFKAFPLTVTGSLPIEEAMVTGGGISTKEIDPRTMGSRIVPGLYFAGEIIEGAASSGGYNLQQAFSTGYLAGESAAR
ncbi:MAG: NAD(P)/FAD-dependent oxidoreductase [Candidatus Omnitrophota bacterium]